MERNIMIRLDNFLKRKNNEELFSKLGKTLTVENGWITMRSNKKGKKEDIKILSDEEGRVRIKGHDTAISLSKTADSYEIDHIQLGNIDKDEINFSMRKMVDEGNNAKYCIKTSEGEKNIICWFSNKEISFNYKGDEERKYFYGADKKTNIRTAAEKRDCFNSLVNLEKKYPAVTAMITSEVPLLDTVTNYCSPSKRNEETVNVYQLKNRK